MKEAILHIDESGHPIDLHCDGSPDRPVSAFILLAHVPADPPGAVILTYGNSSLIGNLLMTAWQKSVHDHPEQAWMIEQVSRAIVAMADAERKEWPGDERSGRA